LDHGIVSTGRIFHAGNHLALIDLGAGEDEMKRTKPLFSIFVALAVFTMVVTTALAEGGSPWGDQYQLPISEDTGMPDLSGFTPLTENYAPEPMVGTQFVSAQPVAPKANAVYTKTPKFYFTKVPGATQYRILVYDWNADAYVYEFTGPGTCPLDVGYCWLQPDKKLKTLQWQAISGGLYMWGVEAYTGSWSGYSAPAIFVVLSPGFNSTFDLDTKKWIPIYGFWERTVKGYYKTLGVTSNATSAAQKEFFQDDYVYEVTMKRKGSSGDLNDLEFHGTPDPTATQYNWIASYLFGYTNSKYWRLTVKTASGTFETIASGTSDFIIPYGWNTLTVWTDTPYIHLWINGGYLGYFNNSLLTSGYVGVRMFKSTAVDVKEPLLVNSARLYYSAISPYAITAVDPTGVEISAGHASPDETMK
jgi:hypothetical protein